MARTIEHEDLQKHTLHLYRGDFDKLGSFYASKNLPASMAVRRIVRAHLEALEAKLSSVKELTLD
jgi:hypothetical protein